MEDTTKLIFLLLLVFPFSSEATHDGEWIILVQHFGVVAV